MAAGVFGAVIFNVGRVPFSVPILIFFTLSSLLSRVGEERKSHFSAVFEKSARRDAGQVLANGLWPVLLLLGWAAEGTGVWFQLYLVALAAAAADTWATEIGLLADTSPRHVITWKPVQPGTSGGVTFLGSSGACLGAGAVALTGWIVGLPYESLRFGLGDFMAIAGAGFLAQATDSILGATVQAVYRCDACGAVTERCVHCAGAATRRVRGVRGANNDLVNFLAIGAGVAIYWIVWRTLL